MQLIPADLFVLVFSHLWFGDLINFCCAVRGFAEQFGANPKARELFRLLWCSRSEWTDAHGRPDWPDRPCLTGLIRFGPVRAAELVWRVLDIPTWGEARHGHYGPIKVQALHSCGVPALQHACANGLLLKAQWVAAHLGLQARHARSGENCALRAACRNGHQLIVAWLIDTFGLGARDVGSVHDYAFRYACDGGHLAVVQRLAPLLTERAIAARDRDALKSVCAAGHLALLQWIVGHFGVTRAVALEADCILFRAACAGGHLAMAQWLTERFALGAAEARICNNWALRRACILDQLAMVQWLTGHFRLDAQDARACERWGLRGGHSTAAWLIEHFKL